MYLSSFVQVPSAALGVLELVQPLNNYWQNYELVLYWFVMYSIALVVLLLSTWFVAIYLYLFSGGLTSYVLDLCMNNLWCLAQNLDTCR